MRSDVVYPLVLSLSALLQINITEDGAAANFTRSFAMKSGYYLCYSKVIEIKYLALPNTTCVFPTSPLSSALSCPT